jgi:hypothetical protein
MEECPLIESKLDSMGLHILIDLEADANFPFADHEREGRP